MNGNTALIQFLQHSFAVSPAEFSGLLDHPEQKNAPLHMLLWQNGLITLPQLVQVFDWLETQALINDPCAFSGRGSV